MGDEWLFRDEEGETHGYYDSDTLRSWLQDGYLASDSEIQKKMDTENGVEDFEWLGMVEELVQDGYTQESSWYYKIEEDGDEHGPYGLYILRAWITEEMLDYPSLLARCAGAGILHEDMEQSWRDQGVFDEFSLLCEIEGVFGSAEDANEDENENEDEEYTTTDGESKNDENPRHHHRHSRKSSELPNDLQGFNSAVHGAIEGATSADRNDNFFQKMKYEREEKARHDATAREAKLAAMNDEERALYMAEEEKKKKHELDKKRMLKRQMKGFKKPGGKGKGKKGRKKK